MNRITQISDQGVSISIETVRGRPEALPAEELLTFWARHGFDGPEARERLDQVVCVLRDGGAIAGASSVFQADVPLIGGRRFWVYRSLLPGRASDHAGAVIRATFEALDAERSGNTDGEPFGLCVPIDPATQRLLPPEAEWRDPRLVYAGYVSNGTQVRIAYFSDQVYVSHQEGGWTPPPGYRIDFFSEQDEITAEDVIGLWTRGGVLSREEADRRIGEVMLIATDPEGRLFGVCTAYLDRNEQLRADFWHLRVFVATAQRAAHFSIMMALVGRDYLEERFTSGADQRGIGMIFEIEYEPWKLMGHKGLWIPSDTILIGDNAKGDHVRVHYFAGARAPEPDA